MFRKYLIIVMALSLFQSISWGADKAPVFTQKDFARLLLTQYSWSDGLPKEPGDRDYLTILGGKRTYKYEAENAFNEKTDRITVREFQLYGPFTGKGWIQGVSDTTSSTFTILLPIAGEYDFKAVIKGNGFVWKIDGKEFKSDSKSANFREVEVAKVKLKAGAITINLSIPPDGAIDYFSLSAPDNQSIQPFLGWRFKEKMTAGRLAEVAVALTNGYAQLPDLGPEGSPRPIVVSEKIVMPVSAALTDGSSLGPFSSPKWIRADYRGAVIQIPMVLAETGYYGLTVNALGELLTGAVNETTFKVAGKPYLEKSPIGLHRLEAGDNSLVINLPPAGGFDMIEFNKKNTTPDSFLKLAGVPGPADRLVTAEEAAALLKKIQGVSYIRK